MSNFRLEQLEVECNLYKQRTNELSEERKSARFQTQEKIDAQVWLVLFFLFIPIF